MERDKCLCRTAIILMVIGVLTAFVSLIVSHNSSTQLEGAYVLTQCHVTGVAIRAATCSFQECRCAHHDNDKCVETQCGVKNYTCYGSEHNITYATDSTDSCYSPTHTIEVSGLRYTRDSATSYAAASRYANDRPAGMWDSCYYDPLTCTTFLWSLPHTVNPSEIVAWAGVMLAVVGGTLVIVLALRNRTPFLRNRTEARVQMAASGSPGKHYSSIQ